MSKSKTCTNVTLLLVMLILPVACQSQTADTTNNCQATAYDEIGPFYRPNAPVRARVGKGYQLKGTVRSVSGCRPLPEAIIEFWLVNERGNYDDTHRATVIADRKGRYSFASNRPVDYVGRLPHIHIRVSGKGHETLITQHYPAEGKSSARLDLILSATKD